MTIKGKVKKKAHENLEVHNVQKVIDLLEAIPPKITKKEAYEILNIAANPTRLTRIIEEHKAEIAEQARRRAANRGKPVNDFEKQVIIEAILDGDPVTDISKRLFRSTASVNKTIEEIGIPERGEDYTRPALLPEQCVREAFEMGELIWVATRNTIGVITHAPASVSRLTGENVYEVYEFERLEEDSPWFSNCRAGDYGGQYGSHRASELGSLAHLKQYGIVLEKTYKPHYPRALRIALGVEVK